MAEQLIATNLSSFRPELKWMARATSSLPVPEDPRIKTGVSTLARRLMILKTFCICEVLPIIFRPASIKIGALAAILEIKVWACTALSTISTSSSEDTGFER